MFASVWFNLAPLNPGQRIGPFEIVSLLGRGGMGEVFLATDTRLDRKVAIKILPAEFASDRQRLCRFEQEAKTLAALDHPNILSIFEVGTHDGTPYLVSQFLEGHTLRDELKSGALSQRKAIDYALQIANGLAAAHAKGIIHRDLKPENIFVTKDGRVKILDFGLAKLKDRGQGAGDRGQNGANSGAVTLVQTTEPGMVLGTVGYMSPEQVQGEEADHRSDIFAFGCILYEMLSGRRAFRKETSAETMTAILREEPAEIGAEPTAISPSVERLVYRCLEKPQERRFQSASDLAFTLENAGASSTASGVKRNADAVAAAQRGRLQAVAMKAVLIVALVGIGISIDRSVGTRTASTKGRPIEATVRKHAYYFPPPTTKSGELGILDLAISPDGQKLAYRNADGLWLKRLDRLDPPKLLRGPGAGEPFWSPQGTQIGFAESGKLYRMSTDGGNPAFITEGGGYWQSAWMSDDRIVFCKDKCLYETVLSSASSRQLLEIPKSEIDYHDVTALPDGKGVLFIVHRKIAFDTLAIWTPESGRKLIYQDEGAMLRRPVYSSSGHILFERADQNPAIWAFGFSLETLTKSDPDEKPFRVAEGALASVARDGTLAFASSVADSFFGRRRLVWVDRATGQITGTIGEPLDSLNSPRISPDGTKVVATAGRHLKAFDTWVFDTARGTAAPLLPNQEQDFAPNWFGGSQTVLYSRWTKDGGRIYTKAVDGLQPEQLLMHSVCMQAPPSARYLLLGRPIYGVPWAYLPLQTTNQTPIDFPETLLEAMSPKLSPDCKWLAYASGEEGSSEIYVVEFPSFTNNTLVSRGGGKHPEWQPDGSRLFYITPDNRSMMSVAVRQDGTVGEPSKACDLPDSIFVGYSWVPNVFDVSADGERLLMIEWVKNPSDGSEQTKPDVVLVENWFEEFRKK